jgi:hypothetical protein
MTKRSKGSGISWKQGVVALVLTITVAYGVAIIDVASRTVRSGGRVDELQAEVNELEAQAVELETAIIEAKSPAEIERAAREELRVAGEGEIVMASKTGTVMPKSTAPLPTPTLRPTLKPTTTGSLPGRWDELMRLILRGLGR